MISSEREREREREKFCIVYRGSSSTSGGMGPMNDSDHSRLTLESVAKCWHSSKLMNYIPNQIVCSDYM